MAINRISILVSITLADTKVRASKSDGDEAVNGNQRPANIKWTLTIGTSNLNIRPIRLHHCHWILCRHARGRLGLITGISTPFCKWMLEGLSSRFQPRSRLCLGLSRIRCFHLTKLAPQSKEGENSGCKDRNCVLPCICDSNWQGVYHRTWIFWRGECFIMELRVLF